MYLHEAVQLSVLVNRPITRKGAWWGDKVTIQPTNTPDGCLLESSGSNSQRGWQPQAEELMADDWDLV